MRGRHLTSADEKPAYKPGTLRLYHMLYCPFAQRARLVLAHKNIKHEEVLVNLTDKPTWLKEMNRNNEVPVLEFDGKILYESLPCMDYLDEQYPGPKLTTQDPYTKARGRLLIDQFAKVTSWYYNILKFSKTEKEKEKGRENIHKEMAVFESMMPQTKFLTGDKLAMADYTCWPWVERYPAMAELGMHDLLNSALYPKLCAWYKVMLETPGVKATINSTEDYVYTFTSYLMGDPDYDMVRKNKAN